MSTWSEGHCAAAGATVQPSAAGPTGDSAARFAPACGAQALIDKTIATSRGPDLAGLRCPSSADGREALVQFYAR